jgi:esterase/lipase superfamily enzyme
VRVSGDSDTKFRHPPDYRRARHPASLSPVLIAASHLAGNQARHSNLIAALGGLRSRKNSLRSIFALTLAGFALSLLAACSTGGAGHNVTVFYATNRKLTGDSRPENTFANVAADHQVVTYGKADIRIPANHQTGSSTGVAIAGYQPLSMPLEDFYKSINPAGLKTPPRDLLVYVHGFNNGFGVAARRAGIFANDLQPNSAPFTVIYSWPSAASLFAYQKDEDSVDLSQPTIRRFLFNLHSRTQPGRTILIGHSMGCRALTFGLRDYFVEQIISHGAHVKPSFNELVFIEPDVTADYFKQNLVEAKAVCRRVTIYTSRHDLALKASNIVHQFEPLGIAEDPLGKNVDVIDASAVKNDFLGHSYDGPPFFADLRQVMQGTPAAARPGLTRENDIYRLKKT